jgi:predicted GNAT family acetyltransferase
MYPWRGSDLADLGILTLPGYRGQGLGRRVIRAMSASALAEGFEPQYRCQVGNTASASLAVKPGFARFGTWSVIADGD